MTTGRLALSLIALLLPTAALAAQDPEDEYAILLEDARRSLRKGSLTSAEARFQEVLDGLQEGLASDRPLPEQVDAARAGILEIALRRGRYEEVERTVAELPADSQQRPELLALRASALRATGRYAEAAGLWRDRLSRRGDDHRAHFELGEVLWAAGQRKAARQQWQRALELPQPTTAHELAWRGRCRWRLGGPEQVLLASQDLVRALEQEPELAVARITLGILRHEVYGEAAGFPSGERDLKRVLAENGDLEEALLAIYRIRSSNFMLDGGRTERFLDRLLQQNPRCVPAIVLRGAGVLDDRRYSDAAALFDRALAIDAEHREALAHRAAAAYLLHDERGYRQYRERALRGDEPHGDVDRVLADHLVALYRFADSMPFYEAALAVDQNDVAALQGLAKATVYTGQGVRAKELLQRAKALEPGYVDPWRNNALAVQALLDEQYVTEHTERFEVQMHRDDVEVLREYLLPKCLRAFEVLGRKYSYEPEGPVKVEVFHTWDDFSVRTIGFRGFTALGACFGRFITLVSPSDSDLRRQDFMWEATVWHEYAHVLTLGLSRHRVPRWLTEGFSVYEEKSFDTAWERGMDRELFDAFHNRDIPPAHLLNRLFRGERILFGYYQGGLMVELIARDYGFDKAIELLRAYGDDLETDAAFERALSMPSREFDRRFLEFVERDKLRGMRLVPRSDEAAVQRLLVRAAAEPENAKVRVDLAWAFVQRDNPVDAGPHLAAVLQRDPEHGPALLVRAELLRRRGALAEALDCWRRGFAAGADDFDSRIACARVLLQQGEIDEAVQHLQRAKACWPNCTEQQNAPELTLASIYREQGNREQAMMELKSYVKRTGRAYGPRWTLAEFAREAGDRAEEVRLLRECNAIDPFRRELHRRLGDGLVALSRFQEAALEYEVGAAVSPRVDRDYLAPDAQRPAVDDPAELASRGELWLEAARLRHRLGQPDRAMGLLQRILEQAKDSAAAQQARTLQREWRPR